MNKSTKNLSPPQRERREELLSTLDSLHLSLELTLEELAAHEDAVGDCYDVVTVDALRRRVESCNLALSSWAVKHAGELVELGIDPTDQLEETED